MAINITHPYIITGPDDPDQDVSSGEWNANHSVIMTLGQRLAGRANVGAGPIEEIGLASSLAFDGGSLKVATGGIGDVNLRSSAGLSVLGRSAVTPGTPTDIVATLPGQVLGVNESGTLGFFQIPVFTATKNGLVPASGSASTTAFLRADGVFADVVLPELEEIDITGPITTTNDISGRDLFLRPSSSLTPPSNGDLRIEATDNATLTIKYKGNDGVVRTVELVLEEPEPPTVVLDFVNDTYTP